MLAADRGGANTEASDGLVLIGFHTMVPLSAQAELSSQSSSIGSDTEGVSVTYWLRYWGDRCEIRVVIKWVYHYWLA